MNPVDLSRQVEESYRRYLDTTFYFKDPELRASFREALRVGRLIRGPYLEGTSVFRRGQSPSDLFASILGYDPDAGFLDAILGKRPLYRHQEQSVHKVSGGRNVVVATGTGSGKTEAFLYPILLDLYREFREGRLGPGVRALVLYPMNALANDQRERLGELCERLAHAGSPFKFTFGQYTGETPEDERDSRRDAQEHIAHKLDGELVTRSEMRENPPHLLLTNYSMLEYLMLRPSDSPLFDNGRGRTWKFIVLDEVHQYRGSRGIEMAMLLRRLKQRLREGGKDTSFQCIATSATLTGGTKDLASVASFAANLFDEPFEEDDVILGYSEPIGDHGSAKLPAETYQSLFAELKRAIESGADNRLRDLVSSLGINCDNLTSPQAIVGKCLLQDSRSGALRKRVTGSAIELTPLAAEIFPDLPEEKRISALSILVELLAQGVDPSSGAPLLSARYHLFLRSLEGAFVAYWPKKQVFLDRHDESEDGRAFEVALCRECGQHYFITRAHFSGGKLLEAVRDPSQLEFGATFLRPLDDDDEADVSEEDGDTPSEEELVLCVRCGEAHRRHPECGHTDVLRVVKEKNPSDKDRADQLVKCGACGYTANGHDPVREVVHGTDGPNAVIATSLYQHLPENRKKLLAFADGRQEAAFFAWYLENSYRDILTRNLILRALEQHSDSAPEGLSLRELGDALEMTFREKKVFPAATGRLELKRIAWQNLYREMLTEEPRISLEGVGLVRWTLEWPSWVRTPQVLLRPPWSLTDYEANQLLYLLLDMAREDRAVELRTSNGIPLNWDDLALQATQMRIQGNATKGTGAPGVRSWSGRKGKRARFLAKLLRQAGSIAGEEADLNQAIACLQAIWEDIRSYDEEAPQASERLMLTVGDARRLNPDWWRLQLVTNLDHLYRCDTCGRIQAVSIRNICRRPKCPGNLRPVTIEELAENHYRQLYQQDLPGNLRVEEHTAQLDSEKAREFQREFRDGKIHVLSSSTTFELGVDLGDLDTVFLRNVPPEPFNYAQRVGRAGRRAGHLGFAITYCRRNPHDLYHFTDPLRMLTGQVRPPTLSIRNEKIILRHVAATSLSHFFRKYPNRFDNVEQLLGVLDEPSAIEDFKEHLRTNQVRIEESLKWIVPKDIARGIGLDDESWIDKIAGYESRLAMAEAEASTDYQTLVDLEETARDRRDYRTADWARRRITTISREDALSFLSRKAVIPKYGFPVDVVELDTQRVQQNQAAFEVLLQRDLTIAISEFAPTSKIIANKKEWTSYGLKRVAEREWDRRSYKWCQKHNLFYQWKEGEHEPPTTCGDRLPVMEYIVPRFGFITDRDQPKSPTSRPPKVFSTRPYFARMVGPEPESVNIPRDRFSPLVTVQKASPGLMVVVCEGRRGSMFYICRSCGAGFRKISARHQSPFGQACNGRLEKVALGHEFVTDVLQLRFHLNPETTIEPAWFGLSLAYAIVEGVAEVLDVPSVELSATTAAVSDLLSPPAIVLYDNVPGGAGLVARLESEDNLRESLQAAQRRVNGECGCDEGTSCYGCLRSYRNQFAHQYLQRGPVLRFLDRVLSEWKS